LVDAAAAAAGAPNSGWRLIASGVSSGILLESAFSSRIDSSAACSRRKTRRGFISAREAAAALGMKSLPLSVRRACVIARSVSFSVMTSPW
jgi:hypothetical protein